MESLIVLAVLGGIGYWLYRTGKRAGSVKGFGVGRRSRRSRW